MSRRQRGKSTGEDAKVIDFADSTQLHRVRFIDRSEEWVNLSEVRFKWLSGPTPGAAPNATWRSGLGKDAAVGRRVRVYWPGERPAAGGGSGRLGVRRRRRLRRGRRRTTRRSPRPRARG